MDKQVQMKEESGRAMIFSNSYIRALLVGLILFAIVALKLASKNGYSPATFPPQLVMIFAVGWIVTGLLVGLIGERTKYIRSWLGYLGVTMGVSILVLGLMLVMAPQPTIEQQPQPKFTSTDEMMVYFAREATGWAKEKNIELDYSMGSIKTVDHELGVIGVEVNKEKPQRGTYGIAMAYGAYVGEVFRRQKGGTWAADSAVAGPKSYPLTLKSNQVIFPVTWCYKRLINGEEDNIYFKARAFVEKSIVETIGTNITADSNASPTGLPNK